MFKKPNFFIIGAPKCGTTSLAAWLAEHPRVFMSEPKELDYFNHDIRKNFRDSLAAYERFFFDTDSHHHVVGEASTGYLRSRVALREILDYSPRALFAVGLRNPAQLACSWHSQMCFEAYENERDFTRAWALQESRRNGKQIPVLCPDGSYLQYGDVCKLGEQMARLYSLVPRERVFVYTLDELHRNPQDLWKRLLAFLDLEDDGRSFFPVLNARKVVPGWLSVTTRLVADGKRRLGLSHLGFGLVNRLNRDLARGADNAVSDHLRKQLAEYFAEDVKLLSSLIDKDLSTWTRAGADV